MTRIFLTAEDSKRITANLYETEKPKGWLLLVHMMSATKESWDDLARHLRGLGYESLAIDLRGHGESEGGPEGYLNFGDAEHQASILDLEAGVEYLKHQNIDLSKLTLAGASIGANLCLRYAAEHPEIKSVILFSPGINYRGLEGVGLAERLKPDQKVFLISSRDDIRPGGPNGPNSDQARRIYDALPEGVKKRIQIYETGGHGTDILKNNPGLEDMIGEFLAQ